MTDTILTRRHIALLDHWKSLTAGHRAIPGRSDFDPVSIPHLLSFLVLSDVEGTELRFRVVGTEVTRAWGSDYTGKTLRDIVTGPYHDYIRDLYDTCISGRMPVASRSRFQWHKGRSLDTIRLMLPLADRKDPDIVGHVLLGQSFDYSASGPETPVQYNLIDGEFVEVMYSTYGT